MSPMTWGFVLCEIVTETKGLPCHVIVEPDVLNSVLHPRKKPRHVDTLEVRRGVRLESLELLTS